MQTLGSLISLAQSMLHPKLLDNKYLEFLHYKQKAFEEQILQSYIREGDVNKIHFLLPRVRSEQVMVGSGSSQVSMHPALSDFKNLVLH